MKNKIKIILVDIISIIQSQYLKVKIKLCYYIEVLRKYRKMAFNDPE